MQQDNSEQVIINPRLIARHYIGTWFFLDLISSIPLDYIFLIFNSIRGSDVSFMQRADARIISTSVVMYRASDLVLILFLESKNCRPSLLIRFLMLNNGFNFTLTELKMVAVGELKPQILQKRNHLSSISTRRELRILKRAFRALRLRLLGISREYILNLAPRFVSAGSLQQPVLHPR